MPLCYSIATTEGCAANLDIVCDDCIGSAIHAHATGCEVCTPDACISVTPAWEVDVCPSCSECL